MRTFVNPPQPLQPGNHIRKSGPIERFKVPFTRGSPVPCGGQFAGSEFRADHPGSIEDVVVLAVPNAVATEKDEARETSLAVTHQDLNEVTHVIATIKRDPTLRYLFRVWPGRQTCQSAVDRSAQTVARRRWP